jgi:3-hydroxyacyl-CoA dehydrogenase/enoyl-CoA hydratase/3-hydroxybutyryl-CoA epimerase
MIDEHGRAGKLAGAGFYEYVDGKRAGLWPGLAEAFPATGDPAAVDMVELMERMLFAEVLDAVKCIEEGVIESVADANVGSILGIGFPRWTGGVLQFVNTYPGGPAGFAARAAELADRYGDRFEPPRSLLEKAESGSGYSDSELSDPSLVG